MFLSALFLIISLFFLEELRKTFLPRTYYVWEEKVKKYLEGNLKENKKFLLSVTLVFTLLFTLAIFFGMRPWFSVWVLLLGFLFVFLKYRKITILEKMYLSVLYASIIPSLILARLFFIDSFLFLLEYLGTFALMQQKSIVTAVTTLLVLPEGTAKKLAEGLKQISDLSSWRSRLTLADNSINQIITNKSKLTSQIVIQRWDEVLGRVAFKENAMHLGKVSNLVNSQGESIFSQYKYKTVLNSFIKTPAALCFKPELNVSIVSILNSAEFTEFISNLKAVRKTMSAGEFSEMLQVYLNKSCLPGLTKEEENLLYHMIFTKAATSELSPPLLKKGTLDILYDSSNTGALLEEDVGKVVKEELGKQNMGEKFGFNKFFNGDAYMKLIKEQEGVAMQERYLNKMGLKIVDVERDAKVDYKIKQSEGKEILLECKSCWQNDIDKEITETFEKVQGPFEMFWENTKTWDKTLYKIDEKGVKHVVYAEISPKKLN